MVKSNLQSEQVVVIQDDKPKRRLWLWWISGCVVIACIVFGMLAFFLFSFSKRSFPLDGKVSFPSTVKKGDGFDFVITLTNSTTKPIFIKHIVLHQDLAAPYLLHGATVINVEPPMEAEPFAAANDVQYSYFRAIQPGETQTVNFHMRAENTGTYYANVGVYAKDSLLPDPAFIDAFHFFDAKIVITP